MSKRGRRASSAASRGDGDGDDESDSAPDPPPTQRKKKRPDPGEVCQQLYDTIRCYKKEDGTLLCDSFIRAPKRRQEPQYYEVVSQPIDLLRVQQKLKTDTYEDIEELSADIELLVNNAKAFYKSDSMEHKDAISLWNLFVQTKQSLENSTTDDLKQSSRMSRLASSSRKSTTSLENVEGDLSETSTNNDDEETFEEYFVGIMSATVEGRFLHPAFMSLPSKKQYPEYYEVIKNPIDLKIIATKVQNCEYTSLGQLERDFSLMTKNACTFNEPGSQIYKDSKALKKVIQAKKQEIEYGRTQTPAKISERIRSKRPLRAVPIALSSAAVSGAVAVPPEAIESDSEKGDSDNESVSYSDSPLWRLLETIKNFQGPNGIPLSEAFWKLPSKRFYPDYYKEIKNPVSLAQIKDKIKKGLYGTVSEVAGDMNILFENAKQYNVPSSRLYKDAVKLQRLMQQRVHELLDIAQESSSEDDESLSSVKSAVVRGRGRPRLNPLPASSPPSNSNSGGNSNSGSKAIPPVVPLKKRLQSLQRHLLEYTTSDGRQPMLLFMEKPSKKLYPDYYNVIEKPIDMLMIESNIKNERYSSIDQIIADFRLMFWNCRQFNEDSSLIYEDANLLERVLNEKLKDMNVIEKKLPTARTPRPRGKIISPLENKLKVLYETIRDYKEPKGNRQLAMIFMKLPTKSEYPDYYELIKLPIDMERIAHKLKTNNYSSLTELTSDFILMFDNACKYNEPDSQIYKDALVLKRLCFQTKQILRDNDDSVPDVAAIIQELLMTLFTTVYNHQDEEGRCFSDSMAELPEHDDLNGSKIRGMSLDLVKRRLDKGLYKRIDHFQEDLFAVWERARNLSRTDSQVFEDSIEMQLFYIATRDQICGEGAILSTPALRVKKEDVLSAVEVVKQCKLLEEHTDEDTETRSSCDENSIPAGGQPLSQTQYIKGDFVYVQPKKGQTESTILQIERVWTNTEDIPMVYGNSYYKPHETYHVTTRRFLEQEVFKTESFQAVPLDQIMGKCCVMNVKDYFKLKPENFLDKDVYVCESRYSTRSRSFKKIKVWPTIGDNEQYVARPEILEPKRIMSVFRERVEKHKDELAELEILENVQEKERPNVVAYNPLGADDENTYYEQYNTVCSGVIKTGDYVYVVTDGGKQMIAQVDTIWETKDGKCYFRGPWLIFPSDVAGTVNKAFYKQEVMLTTVHDSSPLIGIVGKCMVLYYDDYLKCRPTEVLETDIFICEALYDESNRMTKKLKSGLRKYEHAENVTTDEIYFFPRTLGPPPLANGQDASGAGNLIRAIGSSSMDVDVKYSYSDIKSEDVDMLLENSMDESSLQSPATPLSMGGLISGNSGTATPSNLQGNSGTPLNSKKREKSAKKIVTGYILYSGDVRKAISANNPDSTFGEISRLVGNEWRSLPSSTKQIWEEKAIKCNEEKSKSQSGDIIVPPPPHTTVNTPTVTPQQQGDKSLHPDFVFECLWDNCDYQFEDFADCTEHCIGENTGHVQLHHSGSRTASYQCMWRGCPRTKRPATAGAPFPHLARLTRHVKDLHINKGNGRNVPVSERSKNFVASRNKPKPSVVQYRPQSQASNAGQTVSLSQLSPLSRGTPSPAPLATVSQQGRSQTAEALFISVPPRPHRVQHSEAYIRYIEGLHSEQKYITSWDKTLTPAPANPEGFPTNVSKIPVHWFSEELVNNLAATEHPQTGNDFVPLHQNPRVVKALWNLRDLMLRDAFAITKNL